jgi:hypothetical protein
VRGAECKTGLQRHSLIIERRDNKNRSAASFISKEIHE